MRYDEGPARAAVGVEWIERGGRVVGFSFPGHRSLAAVMRTCVACGRPIEKLRIVREERVCKRCGDEGA